ncbi:MAG: hypothetical protein D6802_06355 [Ardenticatenia bacterium]|nr:MAG: hypothetical protein D6802_06355 [Ardenticatenia bacterium]
MLVGNGVAVGSGVSVGVGVAVASGVGVGEGVNVAVGVAVASGVGVKVGFGVLVGVAVNCAWASSPLLPEPHATATRTSNNMSAIRLTVCLRFIEKASSVLPHCFETAVSIIGMRHHARYFAHVHTLTRAAETVNEKIVITQNKNFKPNRARGACPPASFMLECRPLEPLYLVPNLNKNHNI